MPARNAVVRIGLGTLLLATAGLKLYGLGVSAVPQVGWFAQPWVQLAVAEWELVLGLWLISGSAARWSWLAALVTFAAFAAVSGYLGYIGVASCGCFGSIHVNPWWAFGVDVAALLLLVGTRPSWVSPCDQQSPLSRHAAAATGVALGAVALIGVSAGVGIAMYGSLDAALAHLRGERISIQPTSADFGSGVPGQEVEVVVEIVNRTDHPIRLIGGTSDCSCVTTDDLPITLQPEERRPVSVRVRLPNAPGLFNRKALFWTDDDGSRAIVFSLVGKIEPPPESAGDFGW